MESTTVLSPSRSSRTKPLFRIVIALLVLLLIAFLAFDVWFYRAVRAALPQEDGTIQLAGLTQPVMVTRDSLGVPTITAANLDDLFLRPGLRHRAGAALANGHDAPLRLRRSGSNPRP